MLDFVAEISALKQRLYDLQRAVAGDLPTEELPEGELTVLVCRVADEIVALLHTALEEVVHRPTLTPIPESAAWVAGMLDLGGDLVPVIDVQARVARRARRARASDFVVVVSTGERRVGLVVQSVLDVRQVPREQVVPPPQDLPMAPYLMGLIKADGAPVLLVSTQRIIDTSDLPQEQG